MSGSMVGLACTARNYFYGQFCLPIYFGYLKTNKLLSVNPLGSGGVGKRVLMFSGSRSGYVA